MTTNIEKNRRLEQQGKKIILGIMIIFISLLFINFISAKLETGKVGKCVNIQVTSNCSVTLSEVTSPSRTFTINSSMELLAGQTYNYSFCNTSELGEYRFSWAGNCLDCSNGKCGNNFNITPSGKEASIGESILYFVFIIVMFGVFIILFYFILSMPKENERDDNTGIIKIIKIKYLRIFLISIIYPIIMIIFNLMNGLATNFTSLLIFSGTLGFLFETMMRGAWVWTIIMFLWIIISLIRDSNLKKNIKKLGRFKI